MYLILLLWLSKIIGQYFGTKYITKDFFFIWTAGMKLLDFNDISNENNMFLIFI